MGILGQVGGVLGIVQTFCIIILGPIAQFSFQMKAFKRLYLATTERDDLFKQSQSIKDKNKHIYDEDKHASIHHQKKKEIKKNKAIYITLKDYIFLFLSRTPFGCCFKFCWPKYQPFQKLFEEGSTKLEKEMDIVLLIKDLRQLKILL